jgi:tetratricopeptide (TPR) repeat protein
MQLSTTTIEESKNFEDAIYLFNAKLYDKSLEKLDKDKHKFLTALNYFRNDKYEESLEYLNKIDLKKYDFIKNEVSYYKSYSLYYLKKYKKSLVEFNNIDDDFILKREKDILFLKLSLELKNDDNLVNKIIKKYNNLEIHLSSDMEIAILIVKVKLKYNKNSKNMEEAVKIINKILIKNPNRNVILEINELKALYNLKIKLNMSEKIKKCSNLIILHQNIEGNKCFDKFIDNIPKKNNENYCNAHYYNGAGLKKRRKHKDAIDEFNKVIETCKKYDKLDKVNYLAGSSSLMRKDYENAIKYFKELYTKYPKSNLADDGINYIGFIYSLQKKYKDAEKTYLIQIKNFPNEDTTQDAVWKIAYNYYKQKKYNKYINFVKNTKYIENKYFSKGRLEYWLAKTYEKLNNKTKAQEIYKNIIITYNNNFYAYLARMKYKGTLPKQDFTPKKDTYPEFITYLTQKNKLIKLNWLIENGLSEFIVYELNNLDEKDGIYTKYKKEISIFLINAKIYYLPFWHNKINQKWKSYDIDFLSNIDYLRKLYPKAYYIYVEKYAKEKKISPFLVLSIMREESYFHSAIESWANAYGLMQIIEPTAKDLARNLKIKFEREMLFNPNYNIKLGSTYLSWSSKKFKNKEYYIIPSYNAGLNAVRKWKKLKFDKKLKDYDMFIEDIPYTETRHYTKRVLTTYFTYNRLYLNKIIKLK